MQYTQWNFIQPVKRNKIMRFTMLSKISQTWEDRQHLYRIQTYLYTYVQVLGMKYNENPERRGKFSGQGEERKRENMMEYL